MAVKSAQLVLLLVCMGRFALLAMGSCGCLAADCGRQKKQPA